LQDLGSNYPVQRTIRVIGMSCGRCEQTVQNGLNALPGVHQVRADYHTGRVQVAYDLLVTQLQEVEKKLAQFGYPPNNGFGAKIKRNWVNYTEQNKKDNLVHRGHCCSKPPPKA